MNTNKDYFIDELEEFNSSVDLFYVRELYKNNFDLIKQFIKKFGYGLALEDISKLDLKLGPVIEDNRLLMRKINKKIYYNKMELKDIR